MKDIKLWIIVSLVVIIFALALNLLATLRAKPSVQVTSFSQCVALGYPVAEGNPRTCRDVSGGVFIEEVPKHAEKLPTIVEPTLTVAQAQAYAETGVCVSSGKIARFENYNQTTGTWWFRLTPNTLHPGCSPACVVIDSTKESEVKTRCSVVSE